MKTDLQIQTDVMDELKWEPYLNSSEIGVAVKNGVVTLSGIVDSYAKKILAEKAAKKIAGVKAVAEDIQVGPSPSFRRTDAEIAEAVLNALKWNDAVREEKIKVKVENGHVRLEGEVEWDYFRNQAYRSVVNLAGVKSVLNLIAVKPSLKSADIEQKISAALHRSATIDSRKITVEVIGNKVILRGTVRSFAEKADAETAAWNAPGVSNVESKLVIDVPAYAFEEE
jgi:osmotically-inducible protein OsmY